ncbi:MAG: hypothetical protein VW455_00765 [Nitrospinota bacterium]
MVSKENINSILGGLTFVKQFYLNKMKITIGRLIKEIYNVIPVIDQKKTIIFF